MQQAKLWINGQWLDGETTANLTNPYTGEAIAQVAYASKEQAALAIEGAARSFNEFREKPAHERADILYRVASIVNNRRDEFAHTICREAAKPIKYARSEVDRTVQTYLFAAEAARSITGETINMDAAPLGEGRFGYTIRRPLGVVVAITPFNFPANLVAHKVAPAIAAGNTIVLKPAEQTPLTALLLAEIFKEAGLPDGVLNIIPGSGEMLSDVLTNHNRVSYVTFTGSPRVGHLIRENAGLRRVTLELGSNSPLLIDKGFSKTELSKIADETIAAAFAYSGQVCISTQRIFVQESIYEQFLSMMIERAKRLNIGDPQSEDTDISALINARSAERLRTWLNRACTDGAQIHVGGTFDSNVMSPTVLTDVPMDSEIMCEEVFGPVVAIRGFETWQEAIDLANNSKYGLNAGIFTKDLQNAFQAAGQLESGGVMINDVPTFRVDHMPYGGVKSSGVGREGVRYALDDMMDVKFISIRTDAYVSH